MRTEYDKDGMSVFFKAVELLENSNNQEVAIPSKQLIKLFYETPLSVPDNEAINHWRKKTREAVIEDLNRFVKEKNLFVYFDKNNCELRIKKSSIMIYENGKINPEVVDVVNKKQDKILIEMLGRSY